MTDLPVAEVPDLDVTRRDDLAAAMQAAADAYREPHSLHNLFPAVWAAKHLPGF